MILEYQNPLELVQEILESLEQDHVHLYSILEQMFFLDLVWVEVTLLFWNWEIALDHP